MPRFRIVLDVDWDDATTEDVGAWLDRALEFDTPSTPDYVAVDELEDMGT